MPELAFFRRGEEVLRLSIGVERVVLGRGDRCDVVIPDPEVSRQHVSLWLEGERCAFQDLSGKGVAVGGVPQQEGVLNDGMDLALGQWRAVYRQSAQNREDETQIGQSTELVTQPDSGEDDIRAPTQVRVRAPSGDMVFRMETESFTLGKEPGNDLVVSDRFISGRHLKVTRHRNRFQLIDHHSTNGTWLGPVRIFEAEIPYFTSLRLGEHEISLEPATSSVSDAGPASAFGIIGTDPSVRQLAEMINRVAPSGAAVTVLGESGTGKELVARAVHLRSSRAEAPFIPVNCAAISKELIESELFGHEKGSFTGAVAARKGAFEEASGGTLFLDEIGELPLDLQAKLLRALESGEIKRVGAPRPMTVDVRIVAATNRDLLAACHDGKFREDLFYRLCVVPLHLSPLRGRKGDIVPLAEHFLRTFAPRGQSVTLSDAAKAALEAYPWPGNIRELRNVIHRALLLRKGVNVDQGDLAFDARPAPPAPPNPTQFELIPGLTFDQMVQRGERAIVESALRKWGNNRERVARELGMARSTLFKRLREWGVTAGEES
jgi:DNA-binding NtrC family response regulator